MAEFYQSYKMELTNVLKVKTLSRQISENPSFTESIMSKSDIESLVGEGQSIGNNLNGINNMKNGKINQKMEKNGVDRMGNNYDNSHDVNPRYENDPTNIEIHEYLNVTQERNLDYACLDCDPNSPVLVGQVNSVKVANGKVVTAVKDISESGMCIWAGGSKELMLAIKDMESLISVYWEESHYSISQIVRIIDLYLLITTRGKVLILNLGGDLLRVMHMEDILNPEEVITAHLNQETDNTVILGTSFGNLIVTVFNRTDHSMFITYTNKDHIKSVKCFEWVEPEKGIFFSASYDRFINKSRLNCLNAVEVLMKFRMDCTVYCMKRIHEFIALGMQDGIVALMEPNRGNILVSMKTSDRKTNKNHKQTPPVCNLAFFFKCNITEMERIASDAMESQIDFEKYLQKLRIIALTEVNEIHIIAYPMNSEDNKLIKLTNFYTFNQTSKMPIILERLSLTKIRVRVLSSEWKKDHSSTSSWLSEFNIELGPLGLGSIMKEESMKKMNRKSMRKIN